MRTLRNFYFFQKNTLAPKISIVIRKLILVFFSVCLAGRTRPQQGEQTGESGHTGDDCQVPEAVRGQAAGGHHVRGRVQTVREKRAAAPGGTVRRRDTTRDRRPDGPAPGAVRVEAPRTASTTADDDRPPVAVFFRRVFQQQLRRSQRSSTPAARRRRRAQQTRLLAAVVTRVRDGRQQPQRRGRTCRPLR